MALVLPARLPRSVTFLDVRFESESDMLTVRCTACYENQRDLDVVFHDVTRVEFHPVFDRPGWGEPHVMVLWRWNADTRGEEKIVHTYVHSSDRDVRHNREALRFTKHDLDGTTGGPPADLWLRELGWAVRRVEIDHGSAEAAESSLVATSPRWQPPLAEDYGISALISTDDDKKELDSWACAICMDGIKEDRELVSAHEAHRLDGGRRILHVFHRRCLQKWTNCNSTCPTCKTAMNRAPLAAPRWDPGNTTLKARMGENPFVVPRVSV
jgi:hypothetical protein